MTLGPKLLHYCILYFQNTCYVVKQLERILELVESSGMSHIITIWYHRGSWMLCAPTVCQVLIMCRCCVDVVRSTHDHEMCADVVWTLCGLFVVKRPTSLI